MGFFDFLRNKPQHSFEFQERGLSPQVDSYGNVVVQVAGGSSKEWKLNIKDISDEVALAIAGKPKDIDEEIDRRTRLYLRPDLESEYKDSVVAETPSGDRVGWILKNDSKVFLDVLSQLQKGVRGAAWELSERNFTFAFNCHVEGSWDKDEDDDGNLTIPIAGIEAVHVTMKLPASLEIKPAS